MMTAWKRRKTTIDQLRGGWPLLRDMLRTRRGTILAGLALMAINRLSGLVLPGSSKYLVDDVIGAHHYWMLRPVLCAVALATAVQAITSLLLTQHVSKAGQRIIADFRRKVQCHVGRLPVAYYDANKSGALVSRIMTDLEGARNLLGRGLIEFAGGLLTALFAMIALFRISASMTCIAMGIMIVFGIAVRRVFQSLRPIFREYRKIHSEVTGRLTESLGGIRVVKGYHAEEREAEMFWSGARRLLENILSSMTAVSISSVSSSALVGIVSVTVMYTGASQIAAGTLSLGGFVTFTALLAYLVAPVFQVVSVGTSITEALAGLDRIHEVLRERREDEDPRRTLFIPRIQGAVEFEHVSFAYEPGKTVLRDISFRAAPGTVTALVGSSGSGKSTITSLIAAFHVPSEGRALVDGIDLSQVRLDSYRSQLGVVLQETFLFAGTIRDNVLFSRPHASEEEVRRACRLAHVDEFAAKLHTGYETVIGERGVKLSGGQRQRVSIARAILANPRILILDEATSNLDSQSESYIQRGLHYLMQGRTTFVIAHRLSTIRRAGQILVLEDGRIVERGTHESLYKAGGRYWELYKSQIDVEANLLRVPQEESEASTRKPANALVSGPALERWPAIYGEGEEDLAGIP